MKMRKLIFLLALSFSLPVMAQFDYPIIELEVTELLATYTLKWQEDSLNPDFIRQEEMFLFIGSDMSKFVSRNTYRFDTITRSVHSWDEFHVLISDRENPLPHSGISYNIIKNHPTGKLTYIEHTLDGTFKFEEDLNLFDWQLTSDTVTIAGYKAQKATTEFGGRSWIAWFSVEIPINSGPYKFNGLPGLIVKIYDIRMHYVFVLKSIEKPVQKTMIDYVEKDFLNSTKERFFRAQDASRTNIISRIKEKGMSSESQQAAARNMAKRNNPIELKRK